MENSSRALLSAIALAMLAACGGGGVEGGPGAEAAATAPAPGTSRQAGTAPARDSVAAGDVSSPSAVQPTVPGSGADIGTAVDPLVANRVHAELDQIEQALRRDDNGKVEKHEALEVVSGARLELDKERPNKFKLRILLGGLAQGVQGFDGVKGAGKFLGQLVPLI